MGTILGPRLECVAECEQILRSLPRWFGIESALLDYARSSSQMPTFAWVGNGKLSGFVSLKEHFPESWEVYCIAVRSELRGKGIGSSLLDCAETWLSEAGAKFLQVKTLAATHQSPEYAETRNFYAARGFTRLEVFPELWSPANPALQMVKVLNAG